MAITRNPAQNAPGVEGFAIGTHTWRNNSAIGSLPSRARALETADGTGTFHSSRQIRRPRNPLVSFLTTSSYPSVVNRHNASTKYTTTRAGNSRERASRRPVLATTSSTRSR